MEVSEPENGDHLDRDDLLYVSEFLTEFYSFYVDKHDENENLVVTTDDLRAIYEYRTLQNEVERASESERIFDYYNPGSEKKNPYTTIFRDLRKRLDEISPSVRSLEALVHRVEVWSTKAIAQHLLLSHHHQRQHKSDCECWSFILNLPSASYSGPIYLPAGPNRAQSTSKFAQFWDECYNQWRWNKNIDNAAHVSLEERPISPHNPCGLSVPPNAYTWKEYARICHMITLLPHPAAANESAIAKGEVHATHLKWQWRPADLVLLWVRAQRNAQANRHLVQLFQVTTDPDDPTRYKATFRGNHKNTNRRVIQETKLVDQLVQWAVINQGLCTYPLVQALLRSKPKRRTGVPPTSPMLRNPAKRARVDASSTEKDITDDEKASLWWSCQSHFLRAFAQSHRRVLTCLFYSNAKEAIQARKSGLDVDDTALYFLENVVKIQGALPENLRRDRTFARIDRRILLGLFEGPPENDGTMVDKLHETVLGLLRAYEETCRDTNDLHGDDKTTCLKAIQTARVAFDSNYKLLFDQKESRGVVETARSFLRQCTDAESSSVGELLSTLQGLRPPWVERCLECKQSVIRVDKPFRLCVCCRVAMHVECQNDDHPSIYGSKSFVKSCRPLEEVFRVHMPSGLPIPDFTDPSRQNEVTWETKIITIERQVEANGKLQAWGLMLRQTEHCEKCLRKFLRNSVAELENPKEGCPLILPHTGSLVIGMKDTNRQAGKVLQVGDVITGVEFVAFAGIGEAKYASSTLHRLEKMDRKNRGDIFREPATKIRLVVARPSKNLVLEAKRWLEQLQVFNAYQIDLLTENFWFCPQCHWEPTASQTETKGGGDLNRDALHCQAVIRRIARQEECRVFHDENTVNVDSEEESGGKGDENVVSLKRLDNMMDWICNRATHDATDSPRDCSPFFFARRRLSWAPKELESSPFTLLCRGIGLLASPNRKMSNQLHRLSVCRRELLKHFLRAFCSWCLASQPTADLPITTRGPSLYAMRSVFPSEKSYCHCCSVRSLEYPLANAFCTSCLKLASEETTRMDKVVSRCDLVAESYEKCAALVGKSILCLPGDPFLSAASSKLAEIGLTIEHNNRPFQFCIVSYLPHLHGNAGNGGIASGIFHLLPILWPRQLSYVLNRCKLRPPATSFTTEVPKEWGKDGVLELKGVLTLSLKELEDKVAKTKAIYDAIADEVARQADCRCPSNLEAPLRSHRFNGHHASPSTKTLPCASCVTVSAPSGFGVNGWYLNRADLRVLSATIDTLLRSRAPIVLRMLDARRSPPNHEEPLEYQEKEAHVHLPLRFDKKKAPAADVVEFEVIPPGVANYKLLYSDMFFAKTLIQKLSSPLSSPPHDQDEAVEELLNVTLPATEILFERHNVGAFVAWGFELVIWESEAVVRVGRVLQGSAAMSSGLCCNDVVHRINGKVVDRTCSEQFVIWALLALSPVSQHVAHSQRDALATFLQHQSQTKGPVVLQIGRKTSTNQLSNIKEGFDANAASSSGTITRYANGPSVLKQSQIDASAGRATVPLQLPPTSSVPNPLSTPRDWADFTQPGAGNFAGAVSRNNGSRPLQPIYRASDMNYHQLAIDTFIAGSSFISRRHLYVKGLPGTILTLAETAVLLEAISRGHPMLGVRLLCPRYDVSVVYVEIKKLFRLTSLPVPRIHPALWEHITSMDYERSESEPQNGTLCFQDSNYSYRMPTRPFPIDRTIEGIYSRLNARQGTNAPGYNGIQRVRGGGPTHESELAATFLDQNEKSHHQETAEKGKIALSALSDAEKHRTLVCGRCQTSLEGDIHGEANFIGFVESEAQNNQVSVNIFYLSNVGIVSKPLSYVLDAKDLWLATDDEFKIAKNGGFALQSSISNGFWRFFLAESPSSKDTTGTGTELPLAFPENLDSSLERPVGSHQLNTEPPEGNLLNRRISRPQAAESVEFPVVQPTTTCQLGALLDGRKIYWFHSDPEALYVCATGFYNDPQSALSEERQIRAENAYLEDVIADSSPLPRRTAPRHLPCCILGCTERRSDSSITCRFFPSRPLLLAHYHAHHNFGTDQDTSKRFLSGQLDRIEQKEGIQLLMCSIAASACAIDSSLLCLTASVGGDGGPVEASRASPMTPLFCFSSDAATSAKTKELARGGLRSPRASQLLKLGLTVSTLFENDGTSKKTTHGSRDGKPSSPLRTLDGGHSQVVSDACHICNIGSERTVRTDDGSGYKGLGCAAASTVCLGGVLEGEEKRLSNAQKLLLAAARRAPKARENAGATPIPQLSQQLWCDKSLDTWQILVTRSRSLAALVHATAILVSSLDRKMLPEWWIDDCNGWSHVQSVLQIDSIERLYLYLYVLDAALCEYASVAMTSFENVPKAALPPEFKGSTYDEIVGQVFAYMKSHDIPTFQGINGEYCCVCSDGGELLCCELCSNVQHPDCVLPEPLKYTPDRFVCTCCIVDVAVLIRETIS